MYFLRRPDGIDGNVSRSALQNGRRRLPTLASPSADTGNPAVPILPPTDFAGDCASDGDGDGTPRVDMGALEYRTACRSRECRPGS